MKNPIKTNEQYENELERIFKLIQKDIKPGSNDSDELRKLSVIVKKI